MTSIIKILTAYLCSTDMEVRRKAVTIALNMVTSRNVQEVVLFLKKQLSKTLEQEHDKASFQLNYFIADRLLPVECRISPALDPVYSHLRYQILRSGGQRCTCLDGIPWRY